MTRDVERPCSASWPYSSSPHLKQCTMCSSRMSQGNQGKAHRKEREGAGEMDGWGTRAREGGEKRLAREEDRKEGVGEVAFI